MKFACICGCQVFWRNYKTGGVWKQVIQSTDGGGFDVVESNVDDVRNYTEPKTIRCSNCGKRLKNPQA